MAESSQTAFIEIGKRLAAWRNDKSIGAMGVRQLIEFMSRISPYSQCQLRVSYRIAKGELPVEILSTVLYSEQPSKVDIMPTEVARELVSGKRYPIIDKKEQRLVAKSIFDFTKSECTEFVKATGVLPANDGSDKPARRFMRPSEYYYDGAKKAWVAVIDSGKVGVLIDPDALQALRVNEVA